MTYCDPIGQCLINCNADKLQCKSPRKDNRDSASASFLLRINKPYRPNNRSSLNAPEVWNVEQWYAADKITMTVTNSTRQRRGDFSRRRSGQLTRKIWLTRLGDPMDLPCYPGDLAHTPRKNLAVSPGRSGVHTRESWWTHLGDLEYSPGTSGALRYRVFITITDNIIKPHLSLSFPKEWRHMCLSCTPGQKRFIGLRWGKALKNKRCSIPQSW